MSIYTELNKIAEITQQRISQTVWDSLTDEKQIKEVTASIIDICFDCEYDYSDQGFFMPFGGTVKLHISVWGTEFDIEIEYQPTDDPYVFCTPMMHSVKIK